MDDQKKIAKIILIIALVVVITVLHYSAVHGHLGLHILHRELYFVPILLASFWFGLKVGLTTSVVISLLYAPHVFVYEDPHGTLLTVASQILVFNLVAMVLGWLADRQRRQQKEIVEAENLALLGRAAVAVGYEMKDMLGALKRTAHQAKGQPASELDRDFELEMARLEGVVDTLSSFAAPERVTMLSTDLNEIIRERVERHLTSARKSNVRLEVQLDEGGCPARVNPEMIGRVLDNLIKNAIEFSAPDQTITVRSQRGGLQSRVEVQDQGVGIRPEHLPKMFEPFFTTRERGTGLGLAACKKIMKDLGGDVQVASTWGHGATFTLIIPR
jgi:signal transduction histidine kinase